MRQPFAASDDYGVVGGSAEITLDLDAVDRRHGLARDPEPREPIVVDLPMPVAGDRSDFEEALIENFSRHPWSNLPVTIRLSARDARDQVGRSAVREVALPGRRFFDPMAAALIEMRRDLLWNRDNARRVAQVLRAVSHRPEDAFRIERAYLMLRVALRQLEAGLPGGVSAELRDEVAEALWEVALLVEEGDLADALERLRRAQDRLSEAMRNGADDTEIAELMDELRDAMRDYIRQLAEQQSEDDGERDFAEGESREVTGDQLQQMMDRIQELMEQGRMDEAMELMNQLAMMMENMRVVEGEGSQGEGGPGEQAMEGLGEALRGQQDLSDQTFRELQEQFGQRGFGGQQDFGMAPPRADEPGGRQPGEQDGDGSGAGAGRDPGGGDGLAPGDEGLAERQRALREQLRELEDAPLPGSGGEDGDAARESMEDAGRAMERAEEALREGDGAGALSGQADAIDALRESMRQIGEQVARERGERGEGGGSEFGEAGPDSRRDPLGRDLSRFGQIGTEQNLLDGGEVRNRARELLDEIRRRSGEQDRPELELDYLRRLLERF